MAGPKRGTNLLQVAGFNTNVILDTIRRSPGGVSRVELTQHSGLSAQTVSNICRRLTEEGLVVESGKLTGAMGKPRQLLRLDENSRYALGIYIDPAVTLVALTNLAGMVVQRAVLPMARLDEPSAAIEAIATTARSVIKEARIDRRALLGVGVASPGPLDVATGAVVAPPHLRRWHDVYLRDALAAQLDLPVYLDKDTTAAAVGHHWAGSTSSDNLLFFLYGTGVGVGAVVNGRVMRGYSGNAGDMGMTPLLDDAGSLVRLHEVVLPVQVVRAAQADGIVPKSLKVSTPDKIDAAFRRLCRAADDGHEGAVAHLERVARYIGRACAQLVDMMDSETLVLGGTAWELVADRFLPIIAETVEVESVVRVPRNVVGTNLGNDVAAIGAACLVLDSAWSPHPATLPLAGLG